jgi:hypothetical protein
MFAAHFCRTPGISLGHSSSLTATIQAPRREFVSSDYLQRRGQFLPLSPLCYPVNFHGLAVDADGSSLAVKALEDIFLCCGFVS